MAEMGSLPKRSEVDKQFVWAIEDLYATDELWEKEFNEIKEKLQDVSAYRGRLSESAKHYWNFCSFQTDLT